MDSSELRSQYERLLDMDPALRTLELQALAKTNAPLARRVEELLAADANAGGFLQTPIASLEPLLRDAGRLEQPGDVIGNYQLVSLLGEGSFAMVWLARQLVPFQREVAIKMLRPGLDVLTIVQRFDAERDVLARLQHPHISRLYDAGIHHSGRPYFVMERIKGTPITQYAAVNNLPAGECVKLVIDVARAVEHAHQAGIVHRDLKPANILVSEVDGKHVPVVIDFGIAKLLPTDRDPLRTIAAIPHGTPGYMSPEQFAMSSTVDARTDVYSLGLILYELLLGRRADGSRDAPAVDAAMTAAGLQSGLIAVVQRATAADAALRYPSIAAMADDLERVVRGRRPLARRQGRPTATRLVVLLLGLVLLGLSTWWLTQPARRAVVTPQAANWPEASTATTAWRIQPEGNQGWWSTRIDPIDRRIYAVTTTGDLLVLSLDTGETTAVFRPADQTVIRCELSDDKRRLAVVTRPAGAAEPQLLHILDATTLQSQAAASLPGAVHAIALLVRDGSRAAISTLLSEGPRIIFIDTTTGKVTATGPAWTTRFAPAYLLPSPDQQGVVTVSPTGELVQLDSTDGRKLVTLSEVNPATASLHALGLTHMAVTGDYSVRVLDLSSEREVLRLMTPERTTSASLSVDGQSVFVGTIDHRLITFDRRTALPTRVLDLGGDPAILEATIVADGDQLAVVCGMDGAMRLIKLPAR